ncbi:hypothetical protein B0H11DRAFT_1750479 [Mycena galericulata]|nr:hypothetical protein B0H11DRAFT_1750479 [Mycena galericulata]
MRDLQTDINQSTRLYLLHERREPLEDDEPKAITAVFRHYLALVVNSTHRKALTRLLLSQHPLAVERLRYKKRYHREVVPRGLRRCRFGCGKVETVEHALFFCDESARLREKHTSFVLSMSGYVPEVLLVSPQTATDVLKALIFNRSTVCQVAKFAYQAFRIFEELPLVWPDGF